MKFIPDLDIDLPGIVKVESSEGEAVVEQNPAIRNIKPVQRDPVLLAKALSKRYIERGVLGQIVTRILRVGIAVGKSRTVVDVRGSERTPGES
jgi:hypothetical protein